MVTIFGMPADGVVLFVTCLVVALLAFWWHELRQTQKVVRLSKSQLAKYGKIHKNK